MSPVHETLASHSVEKPACAVTKCRGEVKLGPKRPGLKYCRQHEHEYLFDNCDRTGDTLTNLATQIGVRDDGCWQFGQVWGEGMIRPTITSAGMKWRVVRFLFDYLFEGHKGGLELGHICHQAWCVHPGHVEAMTGKRNRRDRDVLDTDPEALSRADRRRLDELMIEAAVIAVNPAVPDGSVGAAELEEFAASLGPALTIVTWAPVPAPVSEPEPVKATKVDVDLFVDERQAVPLRGRRRRIHM